MDRFLAELEQASITVRRRISGSLTGNYKSYNLGSSYDFYGVRPYYQGDNIKNIDWKAFSRTERIYTKLFTEQKQINVTVLIDNSKSMDFGQPLKWNMAKMCALGISYITLKELNKLNIYSFNDSIELNLNNLNSKKLFYGVLNKLEKITPSGKTNFKESISSINSQTGIIFIITDFVKH